MMPLYCRFNSVKYNVSISVNMIEIQMLKYQLLLSGFKNIPLGGGGLWHINLCRLFNAKPIFIQINNSISNNSLQYKYAI